MRKLFFDLASVLASGLLLTLALPLGEQSYLAWFALVPLLLAFRGRGFLPGFLGGLGAILFAAWLSVGGSLYAHPTPGDGEWIYGSYAKYAFSFSVTLGVWGEPATGRLPVWWFAALATLLEAALLFMIPAHLALSQYRHAFWVQLASVGGVWLVSYAVWWTNFALADLVGKPRFSPGLIVPLVALLFGNAWLPASDATRRLAAMQISDPEPESLRRLQAEATAAGARLVVWPEFAGMPFAPGGDTTALRAVGGAPFVTSFPDDFSPLPHNAAALFSGGKESIRYAKRKLFGGEATMHTPGTQAVTVGDVGLNVCFDSCFPAVIRDTATEGARLIALPTTDPRSANGFVAAMHAAYTPFRAAESGVAFVRADGDTDSMIVDPRGRIVGERTSGDGVLVADTAVGPRQTLYRLLGDWFLWLCGVLVALGLCPRKWTDGLTPRFLKSKWQGTVREG